MCAADHDDQRAVIVAESGRNVLPGHWREQQPGLSVVANLPDEDVSLVFWHRGDVPEDQLNLAGQPLPARMVQVKRENVQCGDLACSVHHDATEWRQIPKVSATMGVGIIRVLVHHPRVLFSVPSARLLLELHKNRQKAFRILGLSRCDSSLRNRC
jgi:hypothetical protein